MSDIILVSNLPTPSNRVVQALDNAGLQVVDLLTLDVFEIHRRTQLSVIDVQNLVRDVITALTGTIEEECTKTAEERNAELEFLTTGDETIDQLLGGGIPTGALTEVTGERFETATLRLLIKVDWESPSCVSSCVSTFNSLERLVDSKPARFTLAPNLPLQHPVSTKLPHPSPQNSSIIRLHTSRLKTLILLSTPSPRTEIEFSTSIVRTSNPKNTLFRTNCL